MNKIVEIGSSSVHIVHGALGTGIKKSMLASEKLLLSLFYLFEDAPAYREDFINITEYNIPQEILYDKVAFWYANGSVGYCDLAKHCQVYSWVNEKAKI